MWTIAYEFRCYVAVALLGICGLNLRRRWWAVIWVIFLLLSLAPGHVAKISFPGEKFLFSSISTMIHLFTFFCTGACFYLFRDYIRYHMSWAGAAAIIFCACLFKPTTAQFGQVVLGSYILFTIAFARIPFVANFGKLPDISYGVYLYGWPIQQLFIWYIPSVSPWMLFAMTLPTTAACGWLSWQLVERPFMRLKRSSNLPIIWVYLLNPR